MREPAEMLPPAEPKHSEQRDTFTLLTPQIQSRVQIPQFYSQEVATDDLKYMKDTLA